MPVIQISDMMHICNSEEANHSTYIIIRFFSSIINIQLSVKDANQINIVHMRNMAKKLRNNRRKTAGKFTTNLTQYLPLCNPAKYEYTYDKATGFITVKNIR